MTTKIKKSDLAKFRGTTTHNLLWITGDRPWVHDYVKTSVDDANGTITLSWPMLNEFEELVPFEATISFVGENGETSLEAAYRNAVKVFDEKYDEFTKQSKDASLSEEARYLADHHAEKVFVMSMMYKDAYHIEFGKDIEK